MSDKKYLRWKIILAIGMLVALLAITTIALAGASWTIDAEHTPTWNGVDWVFEGSVTLRNPHHYSCVHVSVPNGPNTGSFSQLCSGGGGAGTYAFQCVVSGSSVADSLAPAEWYLFADSNSSCNSGNIVRGPGGTFGPTGPTAISLWDAEVSTSEGFVRAVLIAIILMAAATGLVVLRKRRTAKQTET